MSSRHDSAPDKVTHGSEIVLGPHVTVDTTTIEKDGETYKGYGWSREQADKNAGEKYNQGKKD